MSEVGSRAALAGRGAGLGAGRREARQGEGSRVTGWCGGGGSGGQRPGLGLGLPLRRAAGGAG